MKIGVQSVLVSIVNSTATFMNAVVFDGSEGSAYVRILQQLWKCCQHPHMLTLMVFILPVIYFVN